MEEVFTVLAFLSHLFLPSSTSQSPSFTQSNPSTLLNPFPSKKEKLTKRNLHEQPAKTVEWVGPC